MREAEISVTFQPVGKRAYVLPGTPIAEAAGMAGLSLEMPCGGAGTCGKCRVIVRQGASRPSPADEAAFTSEQIALGFRLACQTPVVEPMIVETPATSILSGSFQILVATGSADATPLCPTVEKRYVELSPPDRNDDAADLTRLESAIGRVDADLDVLAELPSRLRAGGFRGTAVVAEGRLLDFEPSDTRARLFAVAVDVGTTTLAAMLINLATGDELAVTSQLNPQTAFGDDVLSRILCVRERPERLSELQTAVTKAVEQMVGDLAFEAGISRREIYEITFSGNTTMQLLLCGLDPRALGESPFVPVHRRGLSASSRDLGLSLHGKAPAYVMPVIGGFVGGDTVAGILASGLAESEGPALLVDVGTNGEIVLLAGGRLFAASTAAGPAFEGARITHGMRASVGAIDKAVVNGRLRLNVIGDAPPIGLCGTVLIDLVAELLRHGVVGADGRIRLASELPDGVLDDLRRRPTEFRGQRAVLLVSAEESGTHEPIVLTQRDIREVQLASGAIRAGIDVLLRRAGVTAGDLKTVFLAGGFGNYIRRGNAQRMGLLPSEIDRKRIRYQGNTSLAGARLAAVSREARAKAEEIAATTEHVDLSREPGFQSAFADAMVFPSDGDC
jgi:uncharacterized 2Fe-2S/4Fe-4S cluster protein (DUF4445 family)